MRAGVFAGRMNGMMGAALLAAIQFIVTPALAQERLPWGTAQSPQVVSPDSGATDSYDPRRYSEPPRDGGGYANPDYRNPPPPPPPQRYSPPPQGRYGSSGERYDDRYSGDRGGGQGYGQPYEPPAYSEPRYQDRYDGPPPRYSDRGGPPDDRTYSSAEIRDAGHRFFGRVSSGLASIIEHAFQKAGRPSGYILGEEASGAFIAGLRYGEGVLHLKDGTRRRVFWQGPSIGYDFGAEGSKAMVLVYNLYHPGQIYRHFGGVDGSAYLVGGVGITFLKHDNVTLAPIRAGVGLRLGANVGYLKYTRSPTWNPF